MYIEQKLYDGYFAFEALSEHNWDSGVCGICGIAPVFESADGKEFSAATVKICSTTLLNCSNLLAG